MACRASKGRQGQRGSQGQQGQAQQGEQVQPGDDPSQNANDGGPNDNRTNRGQGNTAQ